MSSTVTEDDTEILHGSAVHGVNSAMPCKRNEHDRQNVCTIASQIENNKKKYNIER